MKIFDADIRRNKWKNKDHFHLVKVKDIYTSLAEKMEQGGAAGYRDPVGALTATVYSQDSEAKEEKKTNKQRYAQILVEQMKQKKERKLKEKAERQAMAVDVDVKAGPKIVVPDIPKLIHKQPAAESRNGGERAIPTNSPERELRSRYKTMSPSEREAIHQQNFGFFDNLYGPQFEQRRQYSLVRRAEMDNFLHE